MESFLRCSGLYGKAIALVCSLAQTCVLGYVPERALSLLFRFSKDLALQACETPHSRAFLFLLLLPVGSCFLSSSNTSLHVAANTSAHLQHTLLCPGPAVQAHVVPGPLPGRCCTLRVDLISGLPSLPPASCCAGDL